MQNGAETPATPLPTTGWISGPASAVAQEIEARRQEVREQQATEIREHGGPEAFLRARAPGTLTLFSGPWTTEVVQGDTTAAWVSASNRVAQCAKCPSHGGACAGDASIFSEGQVVRYDPALPVKLHSVPCARWEVFVARRRARRAGVPEALIDWPLARLLVGDGEYPLRAGLYAWVRDVCAGERVPSLLITGRRPQDRTRLAAGIALALLRGHVRTGYTFAPKLATEMRTYFKSSGSADELAATSDSPLDAAEAVRALIFDFVDPKPKGRAEWAPWFLSRVDMMLFARLSGERPTVLVSRLGASDLFQHFEYACAFPVLECDMDSAGFGPVTSEG